jgi:PAS domain S-box-containing protein
MIREHGNSGLINYILLIAAGLLGLLLISLIHTHYSFEAAILVTVLFVVIAQLFLHQLQKKDLFRKLFYKEKETREQLEEYKTILYNIGEAILTTNSEGKVNRMNIVAEKLTGWKASEAAGIKVETILKITFGEEHPESGNPMADILQNGINQIIPAGSFLITGNGKKVPIAGSASPIRNESGEITGGIFILIDQTEGIVARNIQKSRLSLLEYNHRSIEDILQKSIDEICNLTGSLIGFYHFVEKDQVNLSLEAWSTRTLEEYCHKDGKEIHCSIDKAGIWTDGIWADCLRTGEPVIHNFNDQKKCVPEGHGVLKRELVVPVKKEGMIVAILGVGNKSDEYNNSDIEIATFLADVTWELVSRKLAESAITISEGNLARAEIISGTGNWQIHLLTGEVIASEGARKIYGLDSGNIDYAKIKNIPLYEYRKFLDDSMKNLIERNIPYDVEFEIITSDKSERKFIHSLANFDSGNSVVFGVIQDITTRKRDEQTLKSLNNQLKDLNATKDKLFSIIAHDLKSPFSGIIGLTEILYENIEEYESEKIKMFLQEISSTTRNSLIFLENLLVWAKSQTGQLEFNPEELDLETILNEVSGIFTSQLQIKKISVSNSGCSMASIYADRNMVQTVLRNLFSNAIKFTPENGHVEILFRSDDKNAFITFRDNGIGMSKGTKEKLFRERNYNISAGTNGETGSGLGLLICYEFVVRHGGGITVNSEQGKGSEFCFSLPHRN